MATALTERLNPKVVPQAEWVAARKELLAKEKEFSRLRDELSQRRRELPWKKVDKQYVFEGLPGKQTLADLFDGRSQLIVYHFMFGPGWKEGCPSCSFLADNFDPVTVHLAQRDVSFAVVSRASLPEIEEFKRRMGWRFTWVSSHESDFNYDYRVSFSKEEIAEGKRPYNYGTGGMSSEEGPGASVFYKDHYGDVFHTYSTYARGLDLLLTTYNFLDLTPKGRDEDALSYPMAWVRHHDRYEAGARGTAVGAEAKRGRILEPMLKEFHEEVDVTRRILERVPADKLSWRPHPKSMSLGQLAIHIAMVPGALAGIAQGDGLDVSQANFVPPQPKSLQEIHTAFDQSIRQAETCLNGMTDEAAQGRWSLRLRDKEILSKPRMSVLRSIMLNHWYHHRGQLSVYLRLLDVSVPSVYGPSADEKPFA